MIANIAQISAEIAAFLGWLQQAEFAISLAYEVETQGPRSTCQGFNGAASASESERDCRGTANAAYRPAIDHRVFMAPAIMRTFATQMFLPAMANVQSNSLTGLASIVGFLLIFGVILVTTVSSAFHIPFVLTDQVLGFLGNAINSHLGREVEDKVHSVFMLGARMGPQAVGDTGRIRAATKEKGVGGGEKPAAPLGSK